MYGIDKLYSEHRELIALTQALVDMVAQPGPPPAPELANARWKIARLISTHLASEDTLVRQPLMASPFTDDQIAVAQYSRDLQTVRTAFVEHNFRWSTGTAMANWAEYGVAVREQYDALARRAAWEEEEIFPRARAIASIGGMMATHRVAAA